MVEEMAEQVLSTNTTSFCHIHRESNYSKVSTASHMNSCEQGNRLLSQSTKVFSGQLTALVLTTKHNQKIHKKLAIVSK